MAWHQWIVFSWIQFAVSSLFILLIASLVLRWISQPIEKVRLIQWMLAALVATPLLFTFPIVPSRVFDLSSWLASSQDTQNLKPWIENPTLQIAKPTDRVAYRELSSDRIESSVVEFQGNASVATKEPLNQPAVVLERDATRLPIPSSFISVDSPVLAIDFGWLAAVALVTVHFLAVIYFLIQHRLGVSRLRQTLLESTVASESLRSRWIAITNGRGQNVRLYLSTKVETPLTYRWRNPIVVLPTELAEGCGDDLDACLAHEWAHIEGGDALVWFWMNLAQYALWYQPFYWSMRKELRICLELIADYRTVNSVCDPIAYSDLLLRLAKRQRNLLPVTALTMSGQSSQLTRRIRALLNTEAQLRTRCRNGFSVMVVLGFLLLSILASMFQLTTSNANEPRNRIEADDNTSKSKRIVTFIRTVEEKAIDKSQRFKEYVTEDGRRRWERGEANTDATAIIDRSGSKSIMLHHNTKIAISPALEVGSTNHAWQSLQQLKNGRAVAKELLGAKDINGNQASGFRIEQFERTYTIWTNIVDGELVQVEYVSPENEQVTLSEFDFADSIDDSIFDCTAPIGYKVIEIPPRRGPSLFGWAQKKHEPVGMSLEWSRSDRDAKYIAASSDGTRLYVLGAEQMDIIDPENHRLRTFPVDANMVTTADLDGDGTREFITVKRRHVGELKPWKRLEAKNLLWTAAAYSDQGVPRWRHSTESNPYESSVFWVSAADLNGDGRDEVILQNGVYRSSDIEILDSDGKLWQRKPDGVRESRSWDTGDLEGDASPEFVSIGRHGDVLIDDHHGKKIRGIETGFRNSSVQVWKQKTKSEPNSGNFVVTGTASPSNFFDIFTLRHKIASFDSDGVKQWTLDLQNRAFDVLPCPSQPWIAVRHFGAYARGLQVIDANTGAAIASCNCDMLFYGLAWLKAADGEPLLVIGSYDKIEAYRIASK